MILIDAVNPTKIRRSDTDLQLSIKPDFGERQHAEGCGFHNGDLEGVTLKLQNCGLSANMTGFDGHRL
jgi:hypothetical protein